MSSKENFLLLQSINLQSKTFFHQFPLKILVNQYFPPVLWLCSSCSSFSFFFTSFQKWYFILYFYIIDGTVVKLKMIYCFPWLQYVNFDISIYFNLGSLKSINFVAHRICFCVIQKYWFCSLKCHFILSVEVYFQGCLPI